MSNLRSLQPGRCFITGKVKHRSEAAATAEKHRLIARGEDPQTIRIYPCDCGSWHVGRLSVRDQKRQRLLDEKWRKIRQARQGAPRP